MTTRPIGRTSLSVAPATDRPWLAWFGLATVLVIGGALRFWNLTAGLPYWVGADEPVIAERAIHIVRTGDFNPHFFDYPGFYLYLQVLVACVRFLTGAMDGMWRSLNQFGADDLFRWTRALNAALGTTTLFVLYRAGLRWGRAVALVGAALLAVWPNHVRESHFALTDVPLTLLTTVALVLSLRAYETGRLSWFLAAGASVGLAAATKYNGAVALLMPLVAAAMVHEARPSRAWCAVAAIGGAAGAFLAGAPYTLADLPAFLNAFANMAACCYQPRAFGSGARIYVGHLNGAIGWPGVIVAGAGIVWCAARAIRNRTIAQSALIIIFPLVYFYMIATKYLIYARYALPLVPFLCLLMAIVVVDCVMWTSALTPRWGGTIAASVIVGATFFHATRAGIHWPYEYGKPTTQGVAYGLVQQFIPPHSGVAIEREVLRLSSASYRTVYVNSLIERSAKDYVSSGITYVIASSDAFGPVFAHPNTHPDAYMAYRRLLDERGQCLPIVEPAADRTESKLAGPQIRLCRLQTE